MIEADIAEEIARVRGYDTVPAILPDTPMPPYRHAARDPRHRARDAGGNRALEAVTYALVSPAMVERFGPIREAPIPAKVPPAVEW